MTDPKIEEELKKRSHPTFHLKKDPATEAEVWEEDKTAASFTYDTKELEKWIKEEAIPKDLAKFHINEIEEGHRRHIAYKEMVEKLRKEGKEPTIEDLRSLPFVTANMEDIQKSVSFHQFLMENREKLLKILQEPPHKKRKYRQSGHFVDQKLKISNPQKQPTLFDIISTETKDKVSKYGIEKRVEGVRLSTSQDKIINSLMRLLHEKSENRNEDSENFYGGNVESELVPYGGRGQEGKSRVLRIFPSELYRSYLDLDNDDYSGKEIENIKSVLKDTEQQKFLIIYERTYEIVNEKGRKERRTDRIEDFQSLIKIISFFEGLTDEERREINRGNNQLRERRGELVIALNPLLTDQISNKYVEYPEDINKRTMIAAGGPRLVTESMNALRDYLMREISLKRQKCEINEEKLHYLLKLDKYLKQGRRKRILENVESSIQTAKNLRLITGFEKVVGASGQWKYVFHLNQKFE